MPAKEAMPSTTSARLIAPRLSLSSCVRAHVTRSTIGCALASDEERFNHYPATPYASICWQLHGATALIEHGVAQPPMEAGQAVLVGPSTGPTVTHNPGPTAFYIAMFFPEALHSLTGISQGDLVDRVLMADDMLEPGWCALAPAMLHAPDDTARVAVLEDFLEPRWHALQRSGEVRTSVMGDYVRRLGVQAAATGWGRGPRIIERRIRAWAGLPMRTLQRMGRAEHAFYAARDSSTPLSHIALDNGYADQSHMSREAKAITGLSPVQLKARLDHESYWIYRIWS